MAYRVYEPVGGNGASGAPGTSGVSGTAGRARSARNGGSARGARYGTCSAGGARRGRAVPGAADAGRGACGAKGCAASAAPHDPRPASADGRPPTGPSAGGGHSPADPVGISANGHSASHRRRAAETDDGRRPAGAFLHRNRFRVVTLALIALNVLAFAAEVLFSGMRFDIPTMVLVNMGAMYAPLVQAGEVWRLVTPMFLHMDVMHLAFNMVALFSVGEGAGARAGTRQLPASVLHWRHYGAMLCRSRPTCCWAAAPR